MPCSRYGTSRAPNRAAGHGSGRLPPVRRFEGRQIYRRPRRLERMGQTVQIARTLQDDFMQTLPALNGQARTVALRLAATAAALELAARARLIPLPIGSGFTAIKQCFEDWHGRAGSGKYEDQTIIGQAEAFMSIHAHSMRFSDWDPEYPEYPTFFCIYTVFFGERADDGRADFELTPCKLTFTGGFPPIYLQKPNF